MHPAVLNPPNLNDTGALIRPADASPSSRLYLGLTRRSGAGYGWSLVSKRIESKSSFPAARREQSK
jgi:hypothetical protein